MVYMDSNAFNSLPGWKDKICFSLVPHDWIVTLIYQETFTKKAFCHEFQANMKALPNMILHYDNRKARLKNENDELRRKIADLTEKYYRKAGN